jgi:hypothetical protein
MGRPQEVLSCRSEFVFFLFFCLFVLWELAVEDQQVGHSSAHLLAQPLINFLQKASQH